MIKITIAGVKWEFTKNRRLGVYTCSNYIGSAIVKVKIDDGQVFAFTQFMDNRWGYAWKKFDGSDESSTQDCIGELNKTQIKDYKKVLAVIEVLVWQVNSGQLKLDFSA